MKKRIRDSITFKILISMSIVTFLFTLCSSLLLSVLLGSRLNTKNRQINEQYIRIIQNQIEEYIEEAEQLVTYCNSDTDITLSLSYDEMDSPAKRRRCLNALDNLYGYTQSRLFFSNLQQCIVFNMDNISLVSSSSSYYCSHDALDAIRKYPGTFAAQDTTSPVYRYVPSVSDPSLMVFACLYPLSFSEDAYMYLELNPALLSEQLLPYQNLQPIFITDSANNFVFSSFHISDEEGFTDSVFNKKTFHYRNQKYSCETVSVPEFDLIIGCLNNETFFAGDNLYIFSVLLGIIVTTLCAGLLVTRIISQRITEPIHVLTDYIRNIVETNNFGFSSEIEQSSDEIGKIGKAINHLTTHIQSLLTQMEEIYEQKKNTEISLLQSQINPHFLYNTLDSIRWMAVIQKNRNIELTSRALVNLLRNMAKSVGDKISLKEEISLVNDYIYIQKIRYVEAFDFVCSVPKELQSYSIIKFTIQPIVENAILHGIIPTGNFGLIRLEIRSCNDSLLICVEDNGTGMEEDYISELNNTLKQNNKECLTGIGVSNVNARLKLIYGSDYGLTYESYPGKFTRALIRIPKET